VDNEVQISNGTVVGHLLHFTSYGVILGLDTGSNGGVNVGLIAGVVVSFSVAMIVVVLVIIGGTIYYIHKRQRRLHDLGKRLSMRSPTQED
jgi:hypothetical protein